MVVDSSALLAIVRGEAEARAFSDALLRARDPVLPNSSFVECAIAIVGDRSSGGLARLLHEVRDHGLRRVAVDDVIADSASEACTSFAAGSAPARLDASAWISYALARVLDRALLCKGDDFLRTDVAID